MGSTIGNSPIYLQIAKTLGEELAKRKINLIYGGGRNGLMGILADTVLENGGTVTGIITHSLYELEGHDGLTELHKIETMQERKLMMAQLADGFITLPGGLGTLEELFEVWNAAKIKIHSKPIGLLNINNFYSSLFDFIELTIKEGFTQEKHKNLIHMSDDPNNLLTMMMEDEGNHANFESKQPFFANFGPGSK